MSLLFFDGFETELTPTIRWLYSNSGSNSLATAVSDIKRSGTYSIRLSKDAASSNYCRLYKNFDNTTNTLVCGFAIRFNRISTGNDLFFRIGEQNGSRQISLYFDTSGRIYAYDSATSQSLGTSQTVFGVNTQYYIQTKFKADATNGEFTLLVGNQNEIHSGSMNLSTTGNKVDSIQFYNKTSDSYALYEQIDDVYVLNGTAPTNDFLGVCSVYGMIPIENGDTMDFKAVGATYQFQCVDELTINTSDYIYSDKTNDRCLFNFSDLSTAGEIKGVFYYDYVSRSELGQGTSKYKLFMKDSTSQYYESSEVSVYETAQKLHEWMYEKNPISDTTQTLDDVNNMQVGFKVIQID